MQNYYGEMYKRVYYNIHGEEIQRTPEDFPYNYEGFVIWKKDYRDTDEEVYSDRLAFWDPNKYNDICEHVWDEKEQRFDINNPDKISKFLSLYFGEDIVLTGIEQYCNAHSGFPYWAYYYRGKN